VAFDGVSIRVPRSALSADGLSHQIVAAMNRNASPSRNCSLCIEGNSLADSFSRARFLILPWLSIALVTAATYSRLTRLGETRTAVLRSSSGSEGQTAGVHGLEERWARSVYSANPCFTIGRSS
jgi:hypothetical protein